MKLCIALILAAFVGALGGTPASHAADSFTVRAGDGENGLAVNAFLPAAVTVHVGDTISWTFPWFEPHSVTFGTAQSGAPPATPSPAVYDGTKFVTSELTFGPAPAFQVQFTRAGTFAYRCIIHPNMKGTVTVVPAAAPAETVSAVTARGDSEYEAAASELKAIAGSLGARPPTVNTLPDGTTETVVSIAGQTALGDTQLFYPPLVTVRVGDTVRWHSVVHTPHTTTFGPFPAGVPLPGNPAVDDVATPAASYDGSGYWNSGVLGVDQPAGLDFSMVFAKPGTFPYYCILHRSQGMAAQVRVLPVEDIQPPNTGSGRASPGSGGRANLVAASALIALLLTSGGVFAAVRRRAR